MDPLDSLAGRLGVPRSRLSGLDACSPADLGTLDDLVATTFAAEDTAVADGLDGTVRALPRPLRGRARALIFPEDAS
ncbi:hypothetical protein EKO23_07035 [Nocardioides guangzhouensis]|uniref:Uncharacterized protein n=1 Tax=Nocardioides guangzhouensis TaxID=2497878 RepID=A0A4Q4ZI40_9ACTN|nr:hypothetical protein [Nocardioides guangzhouensis]RYP87024.1 hypothetical protein EKO23_07035 [Nocardioides guangzhouensis]